MLKDPGFENRYRQWLQAVTRFADKHELGIYQAIKIIEDVGTIQGFYEWRETEQFMRHDEKNC